MGKHGVLVDPGLLGITQLVRIELAHRNHGVLSLTVNGVAIHRQVGGKSVVLPVLFHLAKSAGHDRGVQQTYRGGRLAVRPELAGSSLRGCLIGFFLYVSDSEGVTSRFDVVSDVGRFEFLGGRIDLEPLHQPRVKPAHQQRGQHHDADSGSGNDPRLPKSPDDEQHGNDQGNPHQNVLGRQHGMNIGVGRP